MCPWAAIVGEKQDPRTETALVVRAALLERGLGVGGFVHRIVHRPPEPSPPQEAHDLPRWDLELEDLATGERMPYAVNDESRPDVCSLRFAPGVFEIAAGWVEGRGLDVALLGGLGPFEAARHGHWPLVDRLARADRSPLPVLVIRREALTSIALELPGDLVAGLELPADAAAVAAFAAEVARAVGR
ncbi:MAG: DUF2478 domain-containing protein [Deltaproteobacteria bacterium]|nr:DUF2478 domain-containing protein [Deltaproteobacteria bacterium]